jgi:hypothetical protein
MMDPRGPITENPTERPAVSTRWASWVNLILGAILFISPWYSVTWFNPASSWDAWICGIVIMLVAIWALVSNMPTYVWWVNVLLGIWVFIAPWILRFGTIANIEAWTHWIIGVLVFLCAGWIMMQSRRPGLPGTRAPV